MTDTDTKTRILDAAEQLFAQSGFTATSLRAITTSAGVNLAAVHYHFGSKEALVEAVLRRRVEPLNQARLEALDALEARHGEGPVPLEDILEAFFHPVLLLARDSGRWRAAVQIHGRLSAEPGDTWVRIFVSVFEEVARRFLGALHRALPNLGAEELRFRFHFGIGAMLHVLAGLGKLSEQAPAGVPPVDPEGLVAHLVTYTAAGLRAPSVTPEMEAQP